MTKVNVFVLLFFASCTTVIAAENSDDVKKDVVTHDAYVEKVKKDAGIDISHLRPPKEKVIKKASDNKKDGRDSTKKHDKVAKGSAPVKKKKSVKKKKYAKNKVLEKKYRNIYESDLFVRGKDIFTNNCNGCHGLKAQGGLGPKLADKPFNQLKDKLFSFKSQKSSGNLSLLMSNVVMEMNDKDIIAVSYYLSNHKVEAFFEKMNNEDKPAADEKKKSKPSETMKGNKSHSKKSKNQGKENG